MGPKGKGKGQAKGPPPPPAIDPNEVVTELERQFFEIQIEEIEKRIARISTTEETLRAETSEIEEKIEEFKKEKGAVITEHEQLLAIKESEKIEKREEMVRLSNEIKIRIENHKKHVQELETRYNEMVTELTSQLEELEEEARGLDDFKTNKNFYVNALLELEQQIEESERQHKRDLFEIDSKSEMAKVRVKKELESRLLQLSIEFQQISQKRIGNSCHRVTQENKAIEYELRLMREEVEEYEEKYLKSRHNVAMFKSQEAKRMEEKDKAIARTIIQKALMKILLKDRLSLLEKLKEFAAVDLENKALLRKFKLVSFEIEKKMSRIEEVLKSIDEKQEEINVMNEFSSHLRKNFRRIHILARNAIKVAEEAGAVRLIPMGGTEEEKFMSSEAKIRLFKKRRDIAFQKKGRILQYLLDVLSKAQISEEDRKLLKSSTDSLTVDDVNFGLVYGKTDRDVEGKETSEMKVSEEKRSAVSLGSDVSLPRSVSEIQIKPEESVSESMEGEAEDEFGGEDELEDRPTAELPPKEEPAEEPEEPGEPEQDAASGNDQNT